MLSEKCEFCKERGIPPAKTDAHYISTNALALGAWNGPAQVIGQWNRVINGSGSQGSSKIQKRQTNIPHGRVRRGTRTRRPKSNSNTPLACCSPWEEEGELLGPQTITACGRHCIASSTTKSELNYDKPHCGGLWPCRRFGGQPHCGMHRCGRDRSTRRH